VSENTPNSVSVKVSRATYESLNDEQTRIRKETGEKPTLQELLDEAWAARRRGDELNGPETRVPPNLRPCLKMLPELLASGYEDLIGLVVKPLEYALKEVQKRAGQQRKAGL
jgi:hypothetical protein